MALAYVLADILAIAAGVYGAITGAVCTMDDTLNREHSLLVGLWVLICLGSATIAALGVVDLVMRLPPAS
ncbi:hypothetical protein HOU03_gp194 [Caulobacter phage CcrSC]|uniref:Uncharacterized protein n=1 Tax=Caulobacter phage CcrSC TaxID=2283272 RepID=A0A385EDW2_9CAUD|nr:hypothetical protein HOU03_gp194 [Caulobacter phage CcrSC]AXQ70074.1 hypothetical protein CcrSC_gp492 [Caulobacter phage CcrSC]